MPPDHSPGPGRLRRLWTRLTSFSSPGLVGALITFCLSTTGSLIPREWVTQALISGLSAVSGYGIGVALAWFIRTIGFRPRWSDRTRRVARWVLGVSAVIAVPVSQRLGAAQQTRLRELFGLDTDVPSQYLLVIVIALVIALVVLYIGRGLRTASRWLGRKLGRWIPARYAKAAAAVVVAILAVVVFNGTVVDGTMRWLDSVYSTQDETTAQGVEQPAASGRSGSSDSSIRWDTLGYQGRSFVAGGPSQAELRDFATTTDRSPEQVREPIRAYAGLGSAEDPQAVADLVVAELDRTDAWDRAVLVVVTTTGTGWVDPSMSDTLEFLHLGDTAIAAMQYSYLPSWISFVSNRDVPPAAGTTLFDAVYAAWSDQPADARPKLLAFGESLGSYGGQGAFSSVRDMENRTDGALWMGTPNFTPIWSEVTAERTDGSLERHPVYHGGEHIRWGTEADSAADVWDLGQQWPEPRIVYVQHPSDAVVWWSPDLIWHEPDWLREPRGEDVLDTFVWIPVVTFFQVTMDLFFAADQPAGHGHSYHLEYSDGWAAVAPPQGWTTSQTQDLRDTMAQRPNIT